MKVKKKKKVRVILKENVPGLGSIGDVVVVARGYATNYLVPKGFAVFVSESELKKLEELKREHERKRERERKRAEELSQSLNGKTITVKAKAGKTGKLYGSITKRQLAAALSEGKFTVDPSAILLPSPIKSLGEYEIKAKFHPDLNEITFVVNVVAEE
jgi:large subunit ribosomal protein L9